MCPFGNHGNPHLTTSAYLVTVSHDNNKNHQLVEKYTPPSTNATRLQMTSC